MNGAVDNTAETERVRKNQDRNAPPGLPQDATTVRVQDGKTLTSDGPYIGTEKAIGGWYILEADDLDAAIEHASRVPAARRCGAVEIRAVAPCRDQSGRTVLVEVMPPPRRLAELTGMEHLWSRAVAVGTAQRAGARLRQRAPIAPRHHSVSWRAPLSSRSRLSSC
jgi:hypothetical protein